MIEPSLRFEVQKLRSSNEKWHVGCSQRVGNFALRARNVNNCRDTDCTGGTAVGTVARDCVHHRLPQRKSSGSSWSRRLIDFKRCWYKGAAGLSKDKLRRSGQQKQRRARMTLGANAYSTSIKGAVTVGIEIATCERHAGCCRMTEAINVAWREFGQGIARPAFRNWLDYPQYCRSDALASVRVGQHDLLIFIHP